MSFDPEALVDAVLATRDAVRRLDQAALHCEALPYTDAAALLAVIRGTRKDLTRLEQAIEDVAAAGLVAAGQKVTDLAGTGRVELRRGSVRVRWDNDGAARAVIDAHLTDTGGELPPPWEVLRWISEAASFGYWRKTILRAHRIDPGDYCYEEPGRLTVQITS